MAFKGLSQVANAFESSGEFHYSFIYKPSIPSPPAGRVTDSSMSSGVPRYNAYVGVQLESTQLLGGGNNGIYSGESTSGLKQKKLLNMGLRMNTATAPAVATLCDYLMFYPLVDLDSVDLQVMANTVSLPRYESGEGVQMFIVCSVQTTANVSATIEYTDSDGNLKTTTTQIMTGTTGLLVNGGGVASTMQFINLANGSRGVRSVESIQLLGAAGGFGHLVLAKPLTQLSIYEQNTHSEISHIADKATLPKIENGAFLNILLRTNATGTTSLQGEFLFITG